MSVSRQHADWLSLVKTSGPFVSLPVLIRVFPQGLDPRDAEQAKLIRLAYEEWQKNPNLAGKQRAWILHVFTQALEYPAELLTEGQTLPPGLTATVEEQGETLQPDFALLAPKNHEQAGKPQLLIKIYPPDQPLEKPVTGKHWKASPATRMTELLHAADIPLGLVTNGEQWMLVFAPRGETSGFTSWFASLWIDEPITLRAFISLLSIRRLIGVAASDTLLALLKESAQDQQEVTSQLGEQVRDAVEVLIQAFDRLDQDSGRVMLKGMDEKTLYDAALTVMMRLVFLFSAEERGLLHLGKSLYDDNYAVSTLREELEKAVTRDGEEILERRCDAWARLLATFRAVHGGVNHQDLMLPAYGGSLFDPDRYPFLEGRPRESRWHSKPAEPLEISNRVVLHLLRSLQMLRVKVPGGGAAEALRVSFEGLNIEQIGHVYEGLLDHTAVRAREVVLGLTASRKKPVAAITLAELERLQAEDEAKLTETLEELTDKQAKSLRKALNNGKGEEGDDFHKILIASAQDQKLAERIMRFRGLLRQDSFERPVIVLPGGIYVGQGSARRSTGTHYTPRSLTEPIVQHTLEPLVYKGPAEGLAKEQWQLRSPKEILDLKVCDMAMGSGAFLVQACRYLSERLVEAWEDLEKAHPGEVLVTPEGQFSQGEPNERLIAKEAVERLAIARRLVADRCLYGVDINPMAVEMAKLSIWLITVDKSRPFNFLDHAFKCGDSLLGISRFKQLETFSLDDENAKQVIILSNYEELIKTAIAKRRELEMLPSNDAAQIATKQTLLDEAEDRMERLKLAADLLIAAELTEGKQQKKEMARAAAHLKVTQYAQKAAAEFRRFAHEQMNERRTFHWPLEFPEIFQEKGFSAFMGNPPFIGGKKITGTLGKDYRNYAVSELAGGQRGHADLSAYFFLRAYSLIKTPGMLGLLATNTISQGDTREVGLDQIIKAGGVIFRAVKSAPWPGDAALEVAHVWISNGSWKGPYLLARETVSGITPFLEAPSTISGTPVRLKANADKSFIGSYILGMGFLLSQEEASDLLRRNPRNREVLYPFLIGEDLNSRIDQTPSRWVINFHDWPLDRSALGSWLGSTEKEQKVWLTEGLVPSDYPGEVAADYPDCLSIITEKVKPERTRKDTDGKFVLRYPLYVKWWLYADKRPLLYWTIRNNKNVIVVTQTSKFHSFAAVSNGYTYGHKLVVFSSEDFGRFAVLQSSLHTEWVLAYGSSLETRPVYTPSDCFETFPFPLNESGLSEIGYRYHEFRRQLMLSRSEGLTNIYNRLHDPSEKSSEVSEFRNLQIELDNAVAQAYGPLAPALEHGFYMTRYGLRFSINEASKVTGWLLTLNHERYEEEVAAGLHDKKAGTSKRGSAKKKLEKSMAQGELL